MPAELKRVMGLLPVSAIVVGTIIGASIFVQPTEIARLVPSVPGTLLVWLTAGVLTLCGALVCAELAAAYPQSGGVYVFLREGVSPLAGFLWGWAMFWSAHTGIIAASSVVLARYVAYFVPLGDTGIRATAIAAILAVSAVNYIGVRQSGVLQSVVTIAKLAAIAILLLLVVMVGKPAHAAQTVAAAPLDLGSLPMVLAVGAGLFAYGGWHQATYTAEETRDPERTIPLALLFGTLIVTACYFALNAAYFYLLPMSKVIASTHVAADAAETMLGARAGTAVSLLVIVSSVGVLNGVILAGPRVYLEMARERLLFPWAGKIHPRFHTPHVAIALQAAWACVLVATGTYRDLFTRVVYTEWLFFALMTIGLFRLRRRADYQPRFRMWGGPVIPLFFLIGCVIVVGGHVAAQPRQCLEGFLFVLAGLPVYYLWARGSRSHRTGSGSI
jgi:APA family basic amino acid/polyamine antiporter